MQCLSDDCDTLGEPDHGKRRRFFNLDLELHERDLLHRHRLYRRRHLRYPLDWCARTNINVSGDLHRRRRYLRSGISDSDRHTANRLYQRKSESRTERRHLADIIEREQRRFL